MTKRLFGPGVLLCAWAGWTSPLAAQPAPLVRFDGNVRGGLVTIGSSIGYDCASDVDPPGGAGALCTGLLFEGDSAPDLFWVDNNASALDAAVAARTSALLELPADATIIRAQLYWAGLVAGGAGDGNAFLDREGSPRALIIADEVQTLPGPAGLGPSTAYQATANITPLVSLLGRGVYRLTDIDARKELTADDDVFGGWVLVVVYRQPTAPLRRVAIYDGLSAVAPGLDVTATLPGLASLRAPAEAALALWGFEGDRGEGGDRVLIDGANFGGDALNPETNFWNGTRGSFGLPVLGVVPALSGRADSMAGVDLDVIDISDRIAPGAGELVIGAATTADRFWLGGWAVSLRLVEPPDGGTGDPDGGSSPTPGADAGAADGSRPGGGGGDGGSTGPPGDGGSRGEAGSNDGESGSGDGGTGKAGSDVRTVLGGSGCACGVARADRPAGAGAAAFLLVAGLAASLGRRGRRQA